MKILFLCESYLRRPSPNGICIQKNAEYMAAQGVQVDVLTLYSDDEQPEFEKVNGVGIYRVDPGFVRRKVYLTELEKNKDDVKARRSALRLSAFNGLLHAFRYPLLSKKQVRNLTEKGERLFASEKYDCVIAVYHQIHPVLAAINIKRRHPGIKLALYMLDSVSGGWIPRILHSNTLPKKSLLRWEKFFFESSDMIIPMESHRSYYSDARYEKYHGKMHYSDIPLLCENTLAANKPSDGGIHLVFTGSMHPATADPTYLFTLMKGLDPKITVDLYGNVDESIMAAAKNEPLFGKRLVLHGRVPHDSIAQIQADADVLLNFGNANPNMIPSKIFEYMSAGKRIISFTHSDKDSSLPYMRKYPAALIIDETADDEVNIKAIDKFVLDNDSKPDFTEIGDTFRQNTPAYLYEIIAGALEH